MITLRQFFLRMRYILEKMWSTSNTHFFQELSFFKSCASYEITRKYIVQLDRAQMIIRSMRTAFWLPEPTDTHSEHVILLYQRNSVCTKSPHCYILRRLPIFFNL